MIGLPLSLSGADTAQTVETREFAERLASPPRRRRTDRTARRAADDAPRPARRIAPCQRGLAGRGAPARALAGRRAARRSPRARPVGSCRRRSDARGVRRHPQMSDDEDHDDPGAGRLDAAGEERAAPEPTPQRAGASRRQRARPARARPARARPARRRGAGGGARGRYRRRRVVALLVAAIVVFAAWFLIELFQPFGGPGSGIVTVDIPSGANASQIGDVLAAHGVIDSSFFFSLRARLDGDGPKLRHGVITMRHDMSYAAALSLLTSSARRDPDQGDDPGGLHAPPDRRPRERRRAERELPRRIAAGERRLRSPRLGRSGGRAHTGGIPLPGHLFRVPARQRDGARCAAAAGVR